MKRQAVGPMPGFWCECVLYTPTAEFGTTTVDSFDATSAAEAVGWLRFYLSNLTETVSVAESDAARRAVQFLGLRRLDARRVDHPPRPLPPSGDLLLIHHPCYPAATSGDATVIVRDE
jgi:hypothetical protein